jgi:hypothetical protein
VFLGDAAGEEEFGKNDGDAGRGGESGGLFRVRRGEDPALARVDAGGTRWDGRRAHGAYSSSSPEPSWASSITMSWKDSMSSSKAW